MGDSTNSKILKCKIINIEDDPAHPGRVVVSLKLRDDAGEYIRAFSIIPPPRPISVEEFAEDLAPRDLSRPEDPFHYLKEAQESETEFEIEPRKE